MLRTAEAYVDRKQRAPQGRHHLMPWWLPAWVPVATIGGPVAIAAVIYLLLALDVHI